MSRSYKAISYGNNVDESLFGNPARTKRSTLPTNSVVVSAKDIDSMRQRSVLRSSADEMRERAMREAALEEKQKISRMRKEKMLQMERDAKNKAKKSDIELANMEREKAIRELAENQIDENLDMVKMLNSLGARAAAFTIRDQQLADRASRASVEGDYDKRMDLIMEIDRLKELSERERIEEHKRNKRIQDREVIVSQIAANEKRKLLEEEARERENQQMIALMRKYEQEDKVAAERRAVEVARSKAEIVQANSESIRRKEHAKMSELEEMEALRMYQLKKDAELAAREKYEEELANEKREQQRKLLAQQEKSQNKQAEIDELRARRYAEERERKARNDEKNRAERRRQQMTDLTAARRQQAEGKRSIMAREALMQQQEYEDAIRFSVKVQEREAIEAETKQRAADMHRTKLQAQIDAGAESRKQGSTSKFDEGQKLKDEFSAERAKLGAIRDKMVEDLLKKGVNPKYLSEMKMCDIQKIQMR